MAKNSQKLGPSPANKRLFCKFVKGKRRWAIGWSHAANWAGCMVPFEGWEVLKRGDEVRSIIVVIAGLKQITLKIGGGGIFGKMPKNNVMDKFLYDYSAQYLVLLYLFREYGNYFTPIRPLFCAELLDQCLKIDQPVKCSTINH